jgi:hypothetical protein
MRRSTCRICGHGCRFDIKASVWTHDEPSDHAPIPVKP